MLKCIIRNINLKGIKVLEKIKNKWNMMFTNSVIFVAISMVESYVFHSIDKSIMFFGISMVFMGLGELFNQNKKMLDEAEKIKLNQEEIINIIKKSNQRGV